MIIRRSVVLALVEIAGYADPTGCARRFAVAGKKGRERFRQLLIKMIGLGHGGQPGLQLFLRSAPIASGAKSHLPSSV
ncbi:hypothetical protein Rhsp01_43100 [Rhizobium sp. NBRC 114257]|uniref:Uncharacterized protein n=1 Tax=Rhizobium dioscoreae TaxID=2653122 RepID=A0ABQ0ZA26_9HYPH|nr:hypothetical protein RsS93_47610 [Rhizobium dioscoreae]GLU83134.1 hypothetical protein Rhsp01_43100 [Rhizobium sp. NBRC 114257]